MPTKEFQTRIEALKAQVATLPENARPALEALIRETIERHTRVNAACAQMHQSVEDLRLAHTYLQFDLEATRRENASLRQNRSPAAHPENNSEPWCEGAD